MEINKKSAYKNIYIGEKKQTYDSKGESTLKNANSELELVREDT